MGDIGRRTGRGGINSCPPPDGSLNADPQRASFDLDQQQLAHMKRLSPYSRVNSLEQPREVQS
jgi:hypothetical protein